MKLARFIQTNMNQLLEEWEAAALEIAPEFTDDDSHALRRHTRSILTFISDDLVTSQTTDESAQKALGRAKVPESGIDEQHGTYRLRQGLSMFQLVQELRALRARVTKSWGDQQRGFTAKDIDELVRFNESIDQLIANSASHYSVREAQNILERKQTDYQAWQSANFDSLTGLPNRRLFLDRLEQTLLEAERNGTSFALLFIDLDRFKQANDQLGHKGGDRLLVQVAERISAKVRAMDTLARLGGDEFTLILKGTGKDGASEASSTLLAGLEKTFTVDSHRVHISASIGVTLFPDDGRNLDQLMHNADQAMYTAKENGGQQIQIYESWMALSESEHMRLNRELDDALREDQLEVYFQPIVDIRTGAISRAEALLRWNHPYRGLLAPESFLSITEQNGMTDSITAFVLEQAVTCSLRWQGLSDEAFPISINESPASFFTRSLVDQWRARLTQIGLDESRITMELTPESLKNIRASGFNPVKSLGLAGLRLHLSIDDFGIEPFSLSALQEFSLDSVKIDRELIKGAGRGGDSDRILKAIIAMAHAIDIEVVGVGVETDEQLEFLTSAGCDYVQGFLLSPPLRSDAFEALLEREGQPASIRVRLTSTDD